MSRTAVTVSTPRTGYAYLDAVLDPPGAPLAMAHRGGALVPELAGLENTMPAFTHAVALGYRYLETDVHLSGDGTLFAFHDATLDRVTDRRGAIAELPAREIAAARVGGREPIPTLAELLEHFPDARFNIDLKSARAAEPLAELIVRMGAEQRVCVGAFETARLRAFRLASRGRVASSAAPGEVAAFMFAPTAISRRMLSGWGLCVLQLPRARGPVPVVTPGLVRRAHAAGVHVHVWTVDERAHLETMIAAGVDGIFTDRTDVLKDVLSAHGAWREA